MTHKNAETYASHTETKVSYIIRKPVLTPVWFHCSLMLTLWCWSAFVLSPCSPSLFHVLQAQDQCCADFALLRSASSSFIMAHDLHNSKHLINRSNWLTNWSLDAQFRTIAEFTRPDSTFTNRLPWLLTKHRYQCDLPMIKRMGLEKFISDSETTIVKAKNGGWRQITWPLWSEGCGGWLKFLRIFAAHGATRLSPSPKD